jgi:hypothetical protein
VSTLLHATVYMFLHNLLNVLVQIANKMALQKKANLDEIKGFRGAKKWHVPTDCRSVRTQHVPA